MDDYLDDDYLSEDYLSDDFLDEEDYLNHGVVENEMSDYDIDTLGTASSSSSSSSSFTTTTPQQVRATIAGVSVERQTGFWVVFQLPVVGYWPIQVTNDPLDREAATSGQALTMVQLLSNVDMAGVILPPHILAQLVVCALEEEEEDNDNAMERETKDSWQQDLADTVCDQIRNLHQGFSNYKSEDKDDFTYTQSSVWIRSRVRLPLCTLDQVHMDVSTLSSSPGFDLDVVIQNDTAGTTKRWRLPQLQESTVASVLNEDYHGTVSRSFVALALALRYKAPLVVALPAAWTSEDASNNDKKVVRFYGTETALRDAFPLYTTVGNLQQSSNRVVQNIERGFELHQLQAALNMARQKQDYKAMAKIQAKLDEWDEAQLSLLDELPVQPESDMDAMQ